MVASWSLMQEVADSSPFTVLANIFVTEFSEKFRENSDDFVTIMSMHKCFCE